MVVHFFTVLTYREIFGHPPTVRKDVGYLKERFGAGPTLFLALGSRLLITLAASISILAIAGYVLNEVFVHWFPNLGFSFLLLGALLLLNCFGMKVSGKVQAGLVVLSLIGLLSLIISGLLVQGGPIVEQTPVTLSGMEILSMSTTSLFLFIGFDLAGFFDDVQRKTSDFPIQTMVCGIVMMTVVFFCWGWISMKFVPFDRLSETTVPHMVTARAVLGQTGRRLMGTVILAASVSSVNGLLLGTSKLVSEMANRDLLPRMLMSSFSRVSLSLILLVLGIGALLYLGMAGKPVLELFIQAGLCLWLLYYGALHLAVLLKRNSSHPHKNRMGSIIFPLIQILGVVVFLLAFLLQVGYSSVM
jgi:amino acid transporter